MGKSMQPLLKRCKALGINPVVMGYTKQSKRKGKEVRKKKSGEGLQLAEKQKVRFIYGLLEKQFKLTFEKANRMKGKTGENLIVLLERRLDNMVFRMRFAATRKQARQMVNHGHILVNGEKVTIPSYLVKAGDVIEIKEGSKNFVIIKESLKEFTKSGVMPWLEVDPDAMKGTVKALPLRSEVTDLADINEQLIVEFYSR